MDQWWVLNAGFLPARIMPESPRWLLSMGRRDLVIPILQDAARTNKMTLPASLDKHLQQVRRTGSGGVTMPWRPGLRFIFHTVISPCFGAKPGDKD